MEETKRSWKFWAIYVPVALATFALVMGICSMPAKAHAAEAADAGATQLKAATVLTTQSTNTTKAATTKSTKAASVKKATKTTNPYKDVIKGKTVDAKGYNAIKYVKAHKGFNGVINSSKRFYPGKKFTQAQFTKILRNFYGNEVALSKSKTVVTGKWACTKLTKVAKDIFGVKMEWNAGATNTKLTRAGCSNYIRTFATWSDGLFAPEN